MLIKKISYKKIYILTSIIILLLISNILSNSVAISTQINYNNYDWEEIFNNKENIHLVPINTLRTLFLTMNRKSWVRRSELFQRLTIPPVDDEESEYFSYWVKPCFQMGLPNQHFATQITPEGHLYTGSAELLFFAGKNLELINQRIWTLYKGYLPCINYQIEKDNLTYKIQAFQYWLGEKYNSQAINFIKIQIINPTQSKKDAKFSLGFKYGGRDHRPLEMYLFNPFNLLWKYEMSNDYVTRSRKIIYLWDTSPTEKLQNIKKIYQKPFLCINRHESVCLASYDVQLESQETINYTFKMPLYPLSKSNQTALLLLKNAEYNDYLEKMEVFWDDLINQGSVIKVTEDKIMNASKSYFVHNFMCQNYISENEIEEVTNRFQFNQYWITDGFYFSYNYGIYNFHDTAKKLLRHTANLQDETGNIITQPGYWKQVGCALAAFGEYIKITNDTSFAFEIFPNVKKAVGWIQKELIEDRFGLMPFANTKDGPFIVGHYTGHNFWALMGLDGAISVAKAAGEEQAAEEFQQFHDAYRNHFFKQLRITSARNNGVVPPGMDVLGGVHWGNLLMSYRDNLLNPYDPLVNTTFKHYRECHMNEGISTHGNFLHGWRTETLAQTALRRGEQEYVLNDFYSMLLHTGSCHEGFEISCYPFRDYSTRASLPLCFLIKTLPFWFDFTCNGRFSSCINILLRMMLIREDQQALHLFSAISPEWVKPGKTIEVKDAPTYFGMVNLSAIAIDNGINISFKPNWRELPESLVLHMPFFAEIKSILVNGKNVSLDDDYVELPIEECNVNISWIIDPTVDYSYEKFVEDYKSGKI